MIAVFQINTFHEESIEMNLKRYPNRNLFSAMLTLVVFVTHFHALQQTCFACDVANETSCQVYDGYGESAISDWGYGLFVADDFIPLSDTISSIGVWGAYVDNQLQSAPQCADQVVDSFNIRVLTNSNDNDLPQWQVEFTYTIATRTPVENSDVFEYQLALDETIPGLQLDGRKYWIEVANDLWEYSDCHWVWSQIDPINPGNQFSVQEAWGDYNLLSGRTKDHSYCLDIDFTTPTIPIKPCCTCADGVCAMTTVEDCQLVDGQWYLDATDCNEINCTAGPPVNDSCESAIDAADFLSRPYTNSFCATTDGYNPVLTENGNQSIGHDLWYSITTSDGCALAIYIDFYSLHDSVIAIYSNGTSQCPCPTDEQTHLQSFVVGHGESLLGVEDRTYHEFYVEARRNTCYLIRVGGDLAGVSQGLGYLAVGESHGDIFSFPPMPDTDGPGTFSCDECSVDIGQPCMVCSGGSRDRQLCLNDLDCSGGGECVVDDTVCNGGFCTLPYTWPKDRYIGLKGPPFMAGVSIAMRVKMIDVRDHPECNDQIRWVGLPIEYCENSNCSSSFHASQLQDTPYFTDWSLYDSFHIYGDEIIPESRYALQAIDEYSYNDPNMNEWWYSFPMTVQTGKWGDVVAPFDRFTSSSQPSIADILAIVDKWLGELEPRKARAQLQPQIPNPSADVGIADILKAVDAWLGSPYPYPIDSCVP